MTMQPRLAEPDDVLSQWDAGTSRAKTEEFRSDARGLFDKARALYEHGAWDGLGYASWEAYCRAEFPASDVHIWRLLAALQAERNILPTGNSLRIPERQLRELAPLNYDPETQREAWQAIQETAPDSGVTAKHAASVVQAVRDEIKSGTAPADAINKVVESWKLPSPSEADALARETGLQVVGSDGNYHDGKSADERAAIAAEQRSRFVLFDSLQALATANVSAADFAAAVRPDQRYRISNNLAAAYAWLSELVEVWQQ